MKITVNYISNVFLAFVLGLLPYTALIKLFLKNSDTPFLNISMLLMIVINIAVYISAVTGLEIVENTLKAKDIKTHLSSALFILMVLPVLLKYGIGMILSVMPELINYHITIADDIILIVYTIILLYNFYKYSIKAVFFLVPLLIYHIYEVFTI